MTIVPNTTVTQSGYHYILDTIKTVLSTDNTGYGVRPVSDYIGTGTLIRPAEWTNLYNDLNRVHYHQNGTATDIVSTVTYPIATGSIIKQDFVNQLIAGVDDLAANKYTVDSSQLANNSTSTTSGTGTFTYILTSTVVYEWPDERTLDWYFNLGGYIQTDLVAPIPPSYVDNDHRLVVGLVNDFRNTIRTPFNRSSWLTTKTAPGRRFTTSSVVSTSSGAFTAFFTVSNTYQILDSVSNNTSTIRVTTEIQPTTELPLVPLFNLTATVTVTNYISTGSIQAVAPERSYTRDFDDFVASTNVRRTVNLTVNPTELYYTMTGGSTSTTQQITINNLNIDATSNPATITAIQVGSTVVTPYLSHSPFPITVAPGASTTVGLYWDKPTITYRELGEHSNPVVIKSNNTRGDVVIPTRVLVQEPQGTWSFSPSSFSTALTTYKKLTQSINIVPNFSQIRRIVSCTLSQSGNNFVLAKSPNAADPSVVISYEPFNTADGSYVATLTATVEVSDTTGDFVTTTKTFTFTVNQNLVDSNLGNWISALGATNSVVGVSYDVIGGTRYVTIGVGMGADGSPTVDNGGGDPRYADVNYLGVGGDTISASRYKFKSYLATTSLGGGLFGLFNRGTALAPDPDIFLPTYGIVSPQTYIGPNDAQCTFNVDIPTNGNYTIKYSVYETGYVEIDGNKIINLSAYNSNNYQSTTSAVVNLTAGTHAIRFVGNLCMALTVVDTAGNLTWSTLNAVQTGPSYKNWWEVYRIPINMDGQFQLFNSSDYRVKDTATAISTTENKRFPYGTFFGYSAKNFGNIFEIRSNGYGQVTISVLPPVQEGKIDDTVTVASLYMSFYYKQLSIPRYTHKTGGRFDNDPTYTDYFLGFDKYGTVRTDKRLIPTQFSYGSGKNSILDKVITFFLSSLLTDYIIIELGLFTSIVYLEAVGVTIIWSQNISFGAYMLSQLGIDIGASQTVGGYIVNYFSSFFQGSAVVAEGATSVLTLAAPNVQVLGGADAITTSLAQSLSNQGVTVYTEGNFGSFLLESTAEGLGAESVPFLNSGYLTAESAAANVAIETGALAAEGGAAVGAAELLTFSNVAGVILTVDGINRIKEGIEDGDVGAVAVGAAEVYVGYTLAETLITAALAAGCFSKGTPVELADGSVKPIEDIAIGDTVMNHDRTKINRVVMIQISDSKGFANTLWSPTDKLKPFATLNHPVYINGKLAAARPDIAMDYQPWIGHVDQAENTVIAKINDQKVYNIYPDGDATFRVYNYGAPSLADGDTTTFRMYEQGVITFDEVQNILNGIIDESEKYGPNAIYGGVILDRIMRKIGSNLLMKAAIKLWLLKNPKLRSIMFKFITIVGAMGQRIKNKKDKNVTKNY